MRHLRVLTLALIIFSYWGKINAQTYAWNSSSKSAYLGIHSDQLSVEKARLLGFNNLYGSYVTKVLNNTVAEKAGFQVFDYLYGIDNFLANENRSFTDILGKYEAGDKGVVHFIRNGKPQSVDVVFGSRTESGKSQSGQTGFLGVSPHSNEKADEPGVKVLIVEGSTAEEMGLKDGDLLLAINGNKLIDWQDVTTSIGNIKIGEKVAVEYQRDGKTMKAESTIKARSTDNDASWTMDKQKDDLKIDEFKYKIQERGFLGIHSNNVSKSKAQKLGFDNAYGSYVTSVIEESAAQKAGIQPFDYIYGINDYRTNEEEDLTSLLRKFKSGEEVTVHYIRNGKAQSQKIVLGERSTNISISRSECEDPFLGVSQSHQSLGEEGVRVTIIEKSTAEAMGLKDGDVIVSINGYKMIDWEDITAAIETMKVGDNITVAYQRDGKTNTASQAIKSYCDTPRQGDWEWNWDGKSWSRSESDDSPNSERISVEQVSVGLQDLLEAEAASMQQRYGVDMPDKNTLAVSDLQLTPNTNVGMFHLRFNLAGSGDTNVRVFNGVGRLIYQYDLGGFSGLFEDDIDISQNGPGNYYLEVRQNDQRFAKKIVLQSK